MNDITNDEIVNDFKNNIEFEGGGDLSSELDDRKRLLGFIKALDVLGMQNSPDISFKLSVLNTFWEELEVKAEGDVKVEVEGLMKQMVKPKKIYSRTIIKGNNPKPKNIGDLYNLMGKYTALLRKEAHRQLNIKNG